MIKKSNCIFCFLLIMMYFPLAYSQFQSKNSKFFIPVNPPKAKYKIDCNIDVQNGRYDIDETITFKNNTGKSLKEIAFFIPGMNTENIEIFMSGKILQLKSGHKTKTDNPVIFCLPQPLKNNSNADFRIKFSRKFPIAQVLEKRSNIPAGDWFPYLWWGFDTHNDYDVKINIPEEYIITTSGLYDKSSGRFRGENIRSFGLMVGKNLEIKEQKAGDVLVRVFHTEKGEKCADVLMETAVDVINFYREHFGFYPYPVLSIIPGGMDFPAGGYPVATNIVAVHGEEKYPQCGELHWKWITAHEIGHQYFIEHVLQKENHFWLVIGLGIFADREWTRAGNLGNSKHYGFIKRYIRGVREGNNTIAVRHADDRENIGFDFNNVVEHGKGYSIISALDFVLGHETFLKIYKKLIHEWGGKRLGTEEFKAVCETETGQNLTWFFDQWVYSSRFLSYGIKSKECTKVGSKFLTDVKIDYNGELKMPVPVVAYFEDKTIQKKYTDRFLEEQVIKFESSAPVKNVKIDPDSVLALVVPPPDPTIQSLTKKLNKFPWQNSDPDKALELFEKAKQLKYNEYRGYLKIGFSLFDGKKYSKALEAFEYMVKHAKKSTLIKMTGFTWQGHMLDLLGRRQEAIEKYNEALKNEDNGNAMQHSQYGITINKKWIEERLNTPFKND